MKMTMPWLPIAAVLGGLAVIAGAFGAHTLRQQFHLEESQLSTFETGVRYQFLHVFALLVVGLLARLGNSRRALGLAGWCFLVGVLLFSGSLYGLILVPAAKAFLGPVTPIGGIVLVLGWFTLAWAVASEPRARD